MFDVYLLLGGNLGNREKILADAIAKIQLSVGRLIQQSSVYETEPWGFEHEQNFLNQVVVLQSELSATEILNKCQLIEKELGRVRKKNQYAERTIDIDILFYGKQVIATQRLTVPHPRIAERKFALLPLLEIAPDFTHPVTQKTVKKLVMDCPDCTEVKKYKQ